MADVFFKDEDVIIKDEDVLFDDHLLHTLTVSDGIQNNVADEPLTYFIFDLVLSDCEQTNFADGKASR
jgi:hypothetical protein